MAATYLGSGDVSKQRRDYSPVWLDKLADDVTMEASVLDGFAEDYSSLVRGEPIGSLVVARCNDAREAERIVINHRPLRSVLRWSQLMGEHFEGTPYAKYFLGREAAQALYEAMGTR